MNIGDWIGVGSGIVAVIALLVAWYYGHRSTKRPKARVKVEVVNMIPTYDLPDGSQKAGDWFVAVSAVNTGDRPVTITGWGVKLPDDKRMVVMKPPNWSTPVPHRLGQDGEATRFLVPADELFRLQCEQGIPFKDMKGYVTLADGTEVKADRGVPLAL